VKLFNPQGWLTPDQAAELLGLAKRSIRYHCGKGHIQKRKTSQGILLKIDWSYFAERQPSGNNHSGNVVGNNGNPAKSAKSNPLISLNVATSGGGKAVANLPEKLPSSLPQQLPQDLPFHVPETVHRLALEKLGELTDRLLDAYTKLSEAETKSSFLDAELKSKKATLEAVLEENCELFEVLTEAANRENTRREITDSLQTLRWWQWREKKRLRQKLLTTLG